MRHASEPVLLCADHGVRLSSRITTDGDGTVVERVEACEICKRPRFVVKPKKPSGVSRQWIAGRLVVGDG